MGFKSVENNGGVMAEGDYEVICLKAEETETKGGTPVIKLEFQVRSDVEQKYQRKHIFKSFFRDDDTGEWPAEKIGKYANSMGIPKGMDFELRDLCGRCLILHMRPYKPKDGGEERDSIAWTAPTKAGQYGAAPAENSLAGSGYELVDDSEIPF